MANQLVSKGDKMKKLILILMFGGLFGDTVVYNNDVLMFKRTKTLSDISYVGVETLSGKPNIKILISSNILGEKHTWIPCDKILELNDDNGSPIEYDCSEITIANKQPKTTSSHREPKTTSSHRGAVLIALGGGILAYQNNLDPEDIDNYESFKTNKTAGYALIGLGGLIMALENN